MATEQELDFPSPLRDFVRACEVICSAGCCGLAAFDIHQDSVVRAEVTSVANLDLALTQLGELERQVENSPGPFGSKLLPVWGHAADWLPILRQFREAIEGARVRVAEVGEDRPWDWYIRTP